MSLIPVSDYAITLFYKGKEIGIKAQLQSRITYKDSLIITFNSVTWNNSNIKSDSAKISNEKYNNVVCDIDFGKEHQSINGDFTIKFPEDLIRIG
jgi:hypothetical protein